MGPRVKATHHTFRHVSLYKLIQLHEIKGKCKEGPLEDAQKSHKDPPHPPFLSHTQRFLPCKVHKGYRIPTLFLTLKRLQGSWEERKESNPNSENVRGERKKAPQHLIPNPLVHSFQKETVKSLHDGEKGKFTKAGGGNWGRMVISISWKSPREPAVHTSLVKFSSVICKFSFVQTTS